MNRSMICLLMLPIAFTSGCREACSRDEVRFGDRCVLRPDSGMFGDEDASVDDEDGGELDDEMEASAGEPEEDGSAPRPDNHEDAGGGVEDTGTNQPLCADGGCHRKVVQFAYGAPGCAILDDGTLWCWGGVDGSRAPQQVGTATDWEVVSSTDNIGDESGHGYDPGNHTCAIGAGALYCWGENDEGQLGIGTESPARVLEPRRVGDATDWSVVSTSAFSLAGTMSCGIRAGALYCWGFGPNSTRIRAPMRIGVREDWSSISVAGRQVCGIAGSAVRCLSNYSPQSPEVFVSEVGDWTHVSSGVNQICAIRGGKLFCWGSNEFGELGLGVAALGGSVKDPMQVGTASDWTTVECSGTQTCGVRSGELYCWGAIGARDIISLLGDLSPAPRRIGDESDWAAIEPGNYGACGRKASGELRCWGTNAHGELGTTRIPMRVMHEPTQVGEHADWIRIAAGSTSTCGNRGGQLLCWGTQWAGETANTISQALVPTRVGSADDWTNIAMHFSADHACGERNYLSTWCWGSNSLGQLGPKAPGATSMDPIEIPLEHAVGRVAVGADSACARDSDDVFCWGNGWSGVARVAEPAELPVDIWEMTGATIGVKGGRIVEWTSTSPAKQSTASREAGWTKVGTSSDHACGIRGGQIYCWGNNSQGQLGLGVAKVNAAQTTAQLIESPSGWLDVALREGSTCGLRDDRTLWCWGGSFFWRTDSRPIAPAPVQVPGHWEAVAMGGEHSCAIAAGGTLWCWGSNWDGQLGLGDHWSSDLRTVEFLK